LYHKKNSADTSSFRGQKPEVILDEIGRKEPISLFKNFYPE